MNCGVGQPQVRLGHARYPAPLGQPACPGAGGGDRQPDHCRGAAERDPACHQQAHPRAGSASRHRPTASRRQFGAADRGGQGLRRGARPSLRRHPRRDQRDLRQAGRPAPGAGLYHLGAALADPPPAPLPRPLPGAGGGGHHLHRAGGFRPGSGGCRDPLRQPGTGARRGAAAGGGRGALCRVGAGADGPLPGVAGDDLAGQPGQAGGLGGLGGGDGPPVAGPPLLFESTSLAVQAALEGLGAVIVSPMLVAQDVRQGRLLRITAEVVDTVDFYWLVMPPGRAIPALQAFRAWLLEEIAADAAAASPPGPMPSRAG